MSWNNYITQNHDRFFEEYCDLVRIPSVSSLPEHADDVRQAGEWVAQRLTAAGLENAAVMETGGHPVVYADWLHAGPDKPTVLIYGHFDVQPVDPLDLWDTPPFEPDTVEVDGAVRMRGRGTSDDKGQLMTFVEACRAWKEATGALPCRVTILFEGEEESGSPSLLPFLADHGDELKADLALVCDTNMWDAQTPAISTALRGMASEEIIVHGPSRDLHSGYYGGAAQNPIHVLSAILAALHDDAGRVTLDGEPVKLTAQEYKLLSYLMHHKGKVVSRTELIEHIYDQDFDRDSNTIEVFVTRIRKKLGAEVITTIRGLGYSLDDPADAPRA